MLGEGAHQALWQGAVGAGWVAARRRSRPPGALPLLLLLDPRLSDCRRAGRRRAPLQGLLVRLRPGLPDQGRARPATYLGHT